MTDLPSSAIRWHLEPFSPEPADPDPLVAALLEALAFRLVVSQALASLAALQQRYDALTRQHRRRAGTAAR